MSVLDINVLRIAEDIRRSIKPPELIDIGGMKRVKSERSVYVDPTIKSSGRAQAIWHRVMLILFDVRSLISDHID